MYNYPNILFVQREQSAADRPECDICMDFDTNEYPNIFVPRKWHEQISKYICIIFLTQTNIRIYLYPKSWHERISEYIRIQKVDTNEYPNIFVSKKWYERMPE